MGYSVIDAHVNTVVIPPDGGWGWFVVFVAFSWNLVVDGTVYTFGLFMEDIQKDFEATPAFLSLASSLQNGLCFLLGPLVAAMINRLGFRVVSITGGILAFAGVLGSAYTSNVYLFIGTFGGVLGIAFSMIYLSNILIVGFYFTKYRAIATSIATTGTAVGVSVFPIIFSVVLSDIGWREKYKYISGAHLLMAVMASIAYKPVQASDVLVEATFRPTARTGSESLMSSMWNEYDKPLKKNTDYLTNAEALYNQEYTIITPYDFKEIESKTSFKSTRTQHSGKGVSLSNHLTPAEFPRSVRKCCCCRCSCKYLLCKCMWHRHRPLYRDDILFHGSTSRLPQYNKNYATKMQAVASYNMTITRTSISVDLPQNADCGNCCPESVTRVLETMLDLSLLKSSGFLLLCFSGFLTYLGIYVPYIYAIGVSNAVGRVLSGAFTFIPGMNALVISEVTLLFAGAAVVAHPFLKQYEAHMTIACVFGLNIATISSLRTIVVVDLLGLDKLTNAFGLIVMLEGVSCLMALPFNSYLYEKKNSFIYPFVFSGAAIIISGLILIPVWPLCRRERRRALKKDQDLRNKTFMDTQRPATSYGSSKAK